MSLTDSRKLLHALFIPCNIFVSGILACHLPLQKHRRTGLKLEIIFPYDLITQSEIDQLGAKAKHEIFSRCKSHLDDAHLMIALLDGSQVDDGTAWEIGYFYAKRSPQRKIIGVRTDCRQAGESEGAVVDAMIECSCDWIVRAREELLEAVSHSF